MARWYRQQLYGVQAKQDTKINWDGGIFVVKAGDWLVTGDHVPLTSFADADWQALEARSDQDAEDMANEASVLAELERALQRGMY